MGYTMSLTPVRRSKPSLIDRARSAMRSFWRGPYSLKDPAFARLFGDGYQSAAGITVTNENAFTFSAVFDAVNQISSDVGKLPRNHHKRLKGGGSEIFEDSKLQYLLKNEPNEEMTAMVFWRTIIAHALTLKGGYAEIERDVLERPAAFNLLTPDRVEPKRREQADGTLGPLEYLVDNKDWISARNMLHIHGLGYDGINGYGIIALARQTIGLALAAEKFGAQFFGSGTMFSGWLETSEDLDDDQKAGIRKWIQEFRAQQDGPRILVTELGRKFHQFANKPADSQMDESRRNQVEEVARFFRMPPYRLGVNTPGTVSYASVEAAQIDYYTGPILDWVTLIEQELNRKCISRLERRQQFVKHNVAAFLRGTIKERYEALGIARDKGILSADEWREMEDWNPQPNGQGKLYLVQSAQVPVNLLADLVQSQIDKNTSAANPPQPPPSATDQDVQDANDRAARAEQVAEEARQRADEMRAQAAVLEALGQERSGEVTSLREAVIQQQTIAANLTVLAQDMRARAETLETAKAVTDVELLEAREAKGRAEAEAAAAMEQAREAVELADQQKRAADADAEQARQDAGLARAKAEQLETAAAEAAARAETAEGDKAEAEAEKRTAEETAAEARTLALAHEAAAMEQERIATERASELKAARADVDRLTQEAAEKVALAAQLETMQALQASKAAEVQAEIDALKAALAQAEQAREAEREAREHAVAEASEQLALLGQARVAEFERAEAAQRAADDAARMLADAEARAQKDADDRVAAEALALEAEAKAQTAALALEEATTLAREREQLAATAQAAADVADQQRAAADAIRAEAEARAAQAEASAADARASAEVERLARAQAEDARVALLTSAEDGAAQARAHAEALATAKVEADALAAERAAALEAEREADAARLAEAERLSTDAAEAAERAKAEADAASQRAEAAAQAQADAERKAVDAEAAREAIRTAELERMTAVMSAHRELIAGAIERMTRREAEKARQKQSKPETFRRWLNTYNSLADEDLYVQMLRPAIRASIAWRLAGSPEQVTTLAEDKARAMAKEHMATFGAQMAALLDGDPEQFHVQLDRVLTKWEQERAATVADALLVEEIRYVRSQ